MRKFIGASEGASVYIFGLCGGSILMNIIFMFANITGKGSLLLLVPYAVTQIAFLIVIGIYSALRKIDFLAVAKVRKFINWKQWLLLPFITFATILTFLPLSMLFVKFMVVIGAKIPNIDMPAFTNAGVYFLALLVMALLPAIGEEFMMRGIVLNGLNTRGVWFGILISSFLFSFMHASVLQTVHQFGLGIVLSLVVIISGTIWPAVIIHFLNNFITITLSAYIPQVDKLILNLGNWNYLTGLVSVIVGAILLICFLYLFYRAGENKREGYKVVSDGVVFEEFAIYATAEEKKEDKKYKFKNSLFVAMWKYFGSLFSKQGWRKTTRTLESKMDVPYYGKQQPMINVWLAIGFSAFYWFVAFVRLLV